MSEPGVPLEVDDAGARAGQSASPPPGQASPLPPGQAASPPPGQAASPPPGQAASPPLGQAGPPPPPPVLAGLGAPPPGGLIVAPIGGIGEVRAGDDVGRLLASAIGQGVRNGDIVVVASKVVAKAEGRTRPIEEREAAIDGETVRLVARRRTPDGNLRIVENRLGLVMAAAGVDTSNVPPGSVVLLPVDPDASAAAIRRAIGAAWGVSVGVIVADTFGRPWREGSTDQAIGAAGVRVAVDLRGTPDADGRVLRGTVIAVADELAAASELVRGKAAGIAAALIRGAERWVVPTDGPGARALVRPGEQDLFPCGRIDP